WGGGSRPEPKTLADKWILHRLSQVTTSVTNKIEKYELSSAGEELREFTWSDLADWYLEIAKIEKGKEAMLSYILHTLLKLWHPYMPFVTEHIWQTAGFEGQLIVADWPELGASVNDVTAFEDLRRLITDFRRLRADNGIEAAKMVEFAVSGPTDVKALIEDHLEVISTLTRAEAIRQVDAIDDAWSAIPSGAATIGLNLAGAINIGKEREKVQKELRDTETYVANLELKLTNTEFTSKAPEHVVVSMKEKFAEGKIKLQNLRERIQKLG
ncbi:class I tRNA ligase family protein, partial [Candidatus Uhrbacteria bacterium]|nr:class I tRNA ligase family protein [Candidatus Uhrbacteria bacterium]MBD3284592.1 class I tRNA ligase family protein [Candidatus Uhrbacteria bacterium]